MTLFAIFDDFIHENGKFFNKKMGVLTPCTPSRSATEFHVNGKISYEKFGL